MDDGFQPMRLRHPTTAVGGGLNGSAQHWLEVYPQES